MNKWLVLSVFTGFAQFCFAHPVGVVADENTGEVYPAFVENKFTELSGKRVAASFPDDGIVSVTGIVQAVYSDTETGVVDTSAFNLAFPVDRLEFENWGPEGQVVLTTSETNGTQGSISGISDMSVITNGVRLVLANGSGVWVDEAGREIPAENEGEDPTWDDTYVRFHPEIESNTTYWVSAVRGVDLDNYGIHYGDATGVASSFGYLNGSPSGDVPALATHDGVTVYESHYNGGVRKSTDGGLHWDLLSGSPSGNNPALATHDGVTVYESHSGGGVRKSTDGGLHWDLLSGSPSGNVPALATHDGVTVYESHYNGGVRKSTALFGSLSTNTYTFIVTAVTNDAVSIKDFAVGVKGRGDVYCTIETDEDEWSVWAVGEWPLMWKTIAKKAGGSWWVRVDTSGTMVSTAARSAAAAISLAMDTNMMNRVPAEGYSPVYGFGAFTRGRPVKISFTFMPIAAYTNNSANVTGISVLSSRFADGYKWDTDTYDIRLVSTNPAVSEISWPEDVETRSVIYYAPRKREE